MNKVIKVQPYDGLLQKHSKSLVLTDIDSGKVLISLTDMTFPKETIFALLK